MKKKIIKINLFIICVCLAIFFILFILGNIKRVGYLSDILLNIEETLNNNSIHTNRLNINDIEEYILTNDMITNYVYNFRISYYSKVFRNSDIYGVYLNTNSLPDYVKNIRFDEIGSPFGILISDKILEGNIDNIKYTLRLKLFNYFLFTLILFLFIFLFIYQYQTIKKHLVLNKKTFKILSMLFILFFLFTIFLYLIGIKYRTLELVNLELYNFDPLRDKKVLINNNIITNIEAYLNANGITNRIYKFRGGHLSIVELDTYNTLLSNNVDFSIIDNNSFFYKFSMINTNNFILRDNLIYKMIVNTSDLEFSMNNINIDRINNFLYMNSKDILQEDSYYIKYNLRLKTSFVIILILIFMILFLFFILKRNISILLLFLIFLILPNILYKTFYNFFDHTNYENRRFAIKPNFNIKELNRYPTLYETYFNDRLAFKNEIVKLKNITDIIFFKNLISSRYLNGNDKWLFLEDSKLVESFIGKNNQYFTKEELIVAKSNLLHFRDELKKRNIDFVFMVCPDKNFIYEEYMPKYLKRINKYNPTDKFVEYIINNTDIKVVYPKEELLKYKDKYLLYYKYDGHWNNLGAYIGYRELMKKIGVEVNSIDSLNILNLNGYIHEKFSPIYNDIANGVSLSKFLYYMDDRFYIISNYMIDNYNIVKKRNGYNFTTSSYNPINNKNIFVIRDSYTTEMTDYIASSFNRSSFILINDFKKEYILEDNPDIVIFETVERHLKARVLNVISNYKIEEINKDLKTNSIITDN